jgi:prophage regulatory protein
MTFLTLAAVKSRTTLSKTTIYARIKEGAFPKPVSTGLRSVAWVDDEIDAWMRQVVDASRSQSEPSPCAVM